MHNALIFRCLLNQRHCLARNFLKKLFDYLGKMKIADQWFVPWCSICKAAVSIFVKLKLKGLEAQIWHTSTFNKIYKKNCCLVFIKDHQYGRQWVGSQGWEWQLCVGLLPPCRWWVSPTPPSPPPTNVCLILSVSPPEL